MASFFLAEEYQTILYSTVWLFCQLQKGEKRRRRRRRNSVLYPIVVGVCMHIDSSVFLGCRVYYMVDLPEPDYPMDGLHGW